MKNSELTEASGATGTAVDEPEADNLTGSSASPMSVQQTLLFLGGLVAMSFAMGTLVYVLLKWATGSL